MSLKLEAGLVSHKFLLLLVILATMAAFAFATSEWDIQELKFSWRCRLLCADRSAALQEATISYRHFLNIVKKTGFRKVPSETLQEFAEKIRPPY